MSDLHFGTYIEYDEDGNAVHVLHSAVLTEDGELYDGAVELDENAQPVPAAQPDEGSDGGDK